MSVTLDGSVNGGAQTGFTGPTYTLTVTKDNKQTDGYVSAVGGTQVGVRTHAISDPFMIRVSIPETYRLVAGVPSNGILPPQPKNTTRVRLTKGVLPLAGQASQMMEIDCMIKIPAGADAADAPNIRAALSLFIGQIGEISSGLGDTLVQGNI
ncbi:TPA_asm: coat protein [ssRNA phage SRR6254353_1]|uniref:Coat protein n=1 Tax=ssRNA phage SRR6254353_1 TaxID=2786493 RepID=A0A8S5L5J6_9VIRU|nr:coat protein [ssRNA phage SRR6254353_1]DAD52546.1 TPA_asm: coat protein [ssRNA phage SRR6254353_1]